MEGLWKKIRNIGAKIEALVDLRDKQPSHGPEMDIDAPPPGFEKIIRKDCGPPPGFTERVSNSISFFYQFY